MIDTRHATGRRSEASTSPAVWALVLVAATAALCVRIPSFIAVARDAVAVQADALGDAELAGTATAVGAIAAVAIHILLLGIAAVLAAMLERALGPTALGPTALGPSALGTRARAAGTLGAPPRRGRLRLGVGGATFAVVVLGLQVAALVGGVAAIERSAPVWLAAVAVAVVAPAAFPDARASASTFARALVVSAGTAVLLCLG